MQDSVRSVARSQRPRSEQLVSPSATTQLSPTEPGASPQCGDILWRRHDAEGTTKLVEVSPRLKDDDDGHMEYVLWEPTHTERWQHREEDLEDCFWDTGLYSDEAKPVMDNRICELWQRIRQP